MHRTIPPPKPRRIALLTALVAAIAWAAAAPARAEQQMVLLGIATDLAVPGTSPNYFDVTLTNEGPGAITIAGFSYQISASYNGVADGDVTFNDVTADSQSGTYVFAGASGLAPGGGSIAFNPNDPNPLPPQTIAAGDVFDVSQSPVGGTVVNSGETVSLGLVSFSLSESAQFPITISFSTDPNLTNIGDPTGASFTVDSSSGGSISFSPQISPGLVPEPSSISLALLGLGVSGIAVWRRARAARRAVSTS